MAFFFQRASDAKAKRSYEPAKDSEEKTIPCTLNCG